MPFAAEEGGVAKVLTHPFLPRLVIPAEAGIQFHVSSTHWIPASAGMTERAGALIKNNFAKPSEAARANIPSVGSFSGQRKSMRRFLNKKEA